MVPDEISFGAWLRKQRLRLDLSRQALAGQAGCAEVTLRRIEAGNLKPSRQLALILLEKLGIPPVEREQWVRFARGQAGLPSEAQDTPASQLKTNLAALLTSFIGREKEQAQVLRLLEGQRLVTLTGSGGVGKTRLAIQVAGQLLADYAQSVWLVELAPLKDPGLVPQTIASALGIPSNSALPVTETLINFLRHKTVLLVLDNCEHLLKACAGLAEALLKNCPGLKILATGREVLAVPGEASYRVPSLGLPPLENYQEPLHEFESACLFEARARLVQVDFALNMENSAAIAQICNRLDGIPLSIELAAGHVIMFTPAEIAAQLDHAFSVLSGGSRTALPRQQTMRASIDWSWDLLTELERVLLRRLSIFAGGWTLESAQAVCSDDLIKKDGMVDLISQLINKSLMTVNPGSAAGTRYTFHEVVRQYAFDKLVEAGEVERIQSSRQGYFLAFSEQVCLGITGPHQFDWFQRALEERDNLRAAMLYAAQTDQVEPGLYISGWLVAFWDGFDIREGERWLEEFIQRPESKDHPHARATALLAQSELLLWLQQFSQSQAAATECLALYRACADRPGEADALLALGYAHEFLSERPTALEYYQQSLALARSLGDVHRQALALFHLGDASTVKALDFWEEAVPLFRLAGDSEILSGLFYHMANFILISTGDTDRAQKYVDEADKLELVTGRFRDNAGWAKGRIALARGDYAGAKTHFLEVAVLMDELGLRMSSLWSRAHLGMVALHAGSLLEARQILTDTIRNFQEDGNIDGVIYSFEGLAGVFAVMDQVETAARLIGWADAARARIINPRPFLEQKDLDVHSNAIIEKMGSAAYQAAHAAGQAMTLDEAVQLASETQAPL